jgi:DNA-binding transcriptional LysR family regulator
MNSLLQGEIELMLAPGNTHLPNVSTLSLGTVEFAWMASPMLHMDKHVYSPTQLAALPVIGLKAESFHYAAIEEWFRSDQARCQYLARCKSLAVAASLTIAGMGVSYLPVRGYKEVLAAGLLEIIEVKSPFEPVEFVAAFPQGHAYSLARSVAELAQEVSDFKQ